MKYIRSGQSGPVVRGPASLRARFPLAAATGVHQVILLFFPFLPCCAAGNFPLPHPLVVFAVFDLVTSSRGHFLS